MSLSGVVITHNEEHNIVRCLESLSFCDEIIVVDSGSEDRTLEYAKNYTDKVFQRRWNGYADQKNFAVDQAEHEWVISIDADEEVSAELRTEIQSTIQKKPRNMAYLIPRKTMHSGKWIRFGGWYPNYLVRFFNRSKGRWEGNEIHERWESKGETGQFSGHLIHYSFDSISDQVIRNDRYSSLGAQALKSKGIKFSLFKLLAKPVFKFIETYIIKRGFLDGYPGFFISVSAAYSVYIKWAKLWELTKGNGHGQEESKK